MARSATLQPVIRPAAAPAGLGRAHWIAVAVAVTITLVVYLICVTTVDSETSGPDPRDAYYNRLVDGLAAGHLSLAKEMPPALLALANPYDPNANADALGEPYTNTGLHDLSLFRGKLYLYFSVVPALLLFWPYHLLTGGYLSEPYACCIFATLAFASLAALTIAVCRRCFTTVSPTLLGLGLAALGLAPLTVVVLQRPGVYEVPIFAANLFTILSLGCVWRLALEPARPWRWAAALSVCAGLTIGCRPSDVAVLVLLVAPLYFSWRRSSASGRWPSAEFWRVVMAALLPVLLIGIGLLIYNYERFDNPFEFGMRYQLNRDPRALAPFSLSHAAYNAWMYLLHFPGWTAHFPFAGPWQSRWPKPSTIVRVENPVGLLSAVPVVLFAAMLPLAWRRGVGAGRAVISAAVWLAAANAVLMCLFFASITRYQISFASPAVLLGVLGVFAVAEADVGPILRRAFRFAAVAAIVFSAAYGLLFAFRLRGNVYAIKGLVAWTSQRDPAAALRDYEQSLAHDPDDWEKYNAVGGLFSQNPGHDADAIRNYETAIALGPENPQPYYNLAHVLQREPAMRSRAAELYRTAIHLRPDFTAARLRLAELLATDTKTRTAALDEYQALLKSPLNLSEQVVIHERLAALDAELNRREAVVAEYAAIVTLTPNDPYARNTLGVYFGASGRVADAIAQFRAAVALAPNFAEAHNNLGGMLASDPNRRDEAMREYETALRLQPGFVEARRNLDNLLRNRSKQRSSP